MSQLNQCIFREGGLAVTPLQAKYALAASHIMRREFYLRLAGIETPATLLLAGPGNIEVRQDAWLHQWDALVARVLPWLEERMPGRATTQGLDEALNAAKGWGTLWASLPGETIDRKGR
jgi:hypothetical protein